MAARTWVGHRGVTRACRRPPSRAGPEQHHPALDVGGEVLLDRPIDVGRRGRGGRGRAREGVEIAHLGLALAGELGLPLHRVGQVAGHQRDDQEQDEIEHSLGRAA